MAPFTRNPVSSLYRPSRRDFEIQNANNGRRYRFNRSVIMQRVPRLRRFMTRYSMVCAVALSGYSTKTLKVLANYINNEKICDIDQYKAEDADAYFVQAWLLGRAIKSDNFQNAVFDTLANWYADKTPTWTALMVFVESGLQNTKLEDFMLKCVSYKVAQREQSAMDLKERFEIGTYQYNRYQEIFNQMKANPQDPWYVKRCTWHEHEYTATCDEDSSTHFQEDMYPLPLARLRQQRQQPGRVILTSRVDNMSGRIVRTYRASSNNGGNIH